jgi:hypothetical protein
MKKLFYSFALLIIVLSVASCNKNDALQPQKISDPASASSGCNATQLVTYQLTNSTGIATYEIAFSGQQNYTFSFPANGSTTIAVKPGTYNVFVYSPGNYSVHSISLNALVQPIKESGARYDGVVISPCSGPQSVTIDN